MIFQPCSFIRSSVSLGESLSLKGIEGTFVIRQDINSDIITKLFILIYI